SAYKTAQERAQKRSKADWERINQMQLDLIAPLVDLFRSQIAIDDDRVQSIVKDNHLFIDTHFYDCSLDMFSGLGQMYVTDERFTAFYDRFEPGLAAYYNEAIQYYCIANS
ncbi:MAG: TipAS antibiotic-recognition domain-containing protein, partial [Exiguobacterium sp.]|nr:TipAS antibiotic-recognition domain-containing protein [Exiguobacterium sp.]